VDVRSLAEYEQAHLAGAIHIPLEELADRAGELDGNQTIVIYVLSLGDKGAAEAAMLLYERGFTRVVVLEGGIQRWYGEGYVIEGTWLTPTPDEVGPPWGLTPSATGTETTTPPAVPDLSQTPTPTNQNP
jgi:rhodanese-related sulfurtransferase